MMELEITGKEDLLIAKTQVLVKKDETNLTALDMYENYCGELGINENISKGSFNADDSSWFIETLSSIKGEIEFSTGFNYSSEAGLGFYNTTPSNISRRSIASSIPNVSRMYTTFNLPLIFFTFRPPSQDLRSENTKWNENEKGFCIYAEHRRYNSSTDKFALAIQVTEKEVKFFFQKINGTSHQLYLNVFEGNDSTNTTLYNQYHLANLFSDSERTEVIINLGKEYKTYGMFTYNKDVSNVEQVLSSEISWMQETPEGTQVIVSTAVIDKGNTPESEDWIYQPFGSTQILSVEEGANLSNKNLFIKVELETSNPKISPSINQMDFKIMTSNDMKYMQLITDSLERFHNVEGELAIKYDASKGNLRGAGGSVESFEVSFTPEDLNPTPNPYVSENLKILATVKIHFAKVNLHYLSPLDQGIITARVLNVNLDLIHADIINP
ncbi:hypothetical protein SYNTR_0901 [Candidatus Syntrophocurvum alkaliphilum]|uniref:Uncharacterized protein n=1 Tax=Candidatus Syntrophocurvum alkaliphilum TaxID=2293317 RepID=A0A6I6DG15_9FIRM|nr:hypothetical protein [Candidatus Syntrophocurvum alkaliphilum]QGT99494.1 hypothetical protein SYNTR_0901 [Candidatus Syntrophocurvum alkaliphilum]